LDFLQSSKQKIGFPCSKESAGARGEKFFVRFLRFVSFFDFFVDFLLSIFYVFGIFLIFAKKLLFSRVIRCIFRCRRARRFSYF